MSGDYSIAALSKDTPTYLASEPTPSAVSVPTPETVPAKNTPHRALTGKSKQMSHHVAFTSKSISVIHFLNLLWSTTFTLFIIVV